MTHLKLGEGFIGKTLYSAETKWETAHTRFLLFDGTGPESWRAAEEWVGRNQGAGALLGASHGLCFFSKRHAFFLISF